jgi:hypothetical protein
VPEHIRFQRKSNVIGLLRWSHFRTDDRFRFPEIALRTRQHSTGAAVHPADMASLLAPDAPWSSTGLNKIVHNQLSSFT